MPKPKRRGRARPTLARPLTDQILAAIEGRRLTAYALGQLAEVDPAGIARFLSGERDIRLATADRLADALGLRLVEGSRGRGRPGAAQKDDRGSGGLVPAAVDCLGSRGDRIAEVPSVGSGGASDVGRLEHRAEGPGGMNQDTGEDQD